ncbi:concanavalin A-like lectin/glucanase domain-containing protein [Mycena floridula]|nr:concanavalin A-like lectin/glucanase domain-containing protein [Mycena floridula]
MTSHFCISPRLLCLFALLFSISPVVSEQIPLVFPASPPSVKNTTTSPSILDSTARVYKEIDMYKGQDFLDQWVFFHQGDPTHGSVEYQTRDSAIAKGLAVVDPKTEVVTLSVDDHSTLPWGTYRDSVRISSKKQYTGGLFIADFRKMPHGCGTWPAYWSVGPNWPNGGEIDVLEGVHKSHTNQHTLHTSQGCTAVKNSGMTGKLIYADCAAGATNQGCGVLDSSNTSYGAGFNKAGGGVLAHLWDDDGIKIWHFEGKNIPNDITIGKPSPETWGKPVSFFQNSSCNMKSHFYKHSLVINTALCGDWAGNVYVSSGCSGTCATAVMNPKNFIYAKWKINYIAVYN